jgi:hypothetical protein
MDCVDKTTDKAADGGALHKEVAATAETLLALEEQGFTSPSPTRHSPRKNSEGVQVWMEPFTQQNASPIRIRHKSTKGSGVWDMSKTFLLDEYHRVRDGEFLGLYVKNLVAYYGLHKDWFKGNIRKLRKNKTIKMSEI